MRKFFVLTLTLVLAAGAYWVYAGPANGKMALKVGDEVNACGCGTACACQTISNQKGKCHCGHDLVKATVAKVGDGTADLKIGNETRTFKTVGKFVCGCGDNCCQTISQSAGKCGCGKDLVAAK
ncbi:MAG: hypothetical protein EHM61_02390 [Acidobacteria bacterium]|nr:MAG: hypothetical protein EHM61_02390 [Acidobacteriota bacterium]